MRAATLARMLDDGLGSAQPVITELVARSAATHHCPSIAWGVVADGRLVAAGGTGSLDDGSVPTSRTVYRIASMTKSFTAAVVLALRDEGVLRLDDLVRHHAPELAGLRHPAADAAEITIRDLLSMGSGLATDDVWADRHLDLTDDELDAIAERGGWFAQPTGTTFEYSNLGFAVIGRVVRNASGTRLQDHVARRFLEPLAMRRTTWVQPDDDAWARPRRWLDDAHADELAPVADGVLAPMGGLWSTVEDLARWVAFLDRAGSEHDDLLAPASRREMHQMHRYAGSRSTADAAAPTGYGFGLLVRDDPRLGIVCGHSGGLPGYGSNMRWVPGRGLGAIALANVTYAPMADLTLRMLHALHDAGARPTVPRPAPDELADAARRLTMLLHEWDESHAAALFADNVEMDDALARRRAAVDRLVGARWPLTISALRASTDAAASVELTAADGSTFEMCFELAPLRPVRIESWTFSAREPGTS